MKYNQQWWRVQTRQIFGNGDNEGFFWQFLCDGFNYSGREKKDYWFLRMSGGFGGEFGDCSDNKDIRDGQFWLFDEFKRRFTKVSGNEGFVCFH